LHPFLKRGEYTMGGGWKKREPKERNDAIPSPFFLKKLFKKEGIPLGKGVWKSCGLFPADYFLGKVYEGT
jgi:hypothetical protein